MLELIKSIMMPKTMPDKIEITFTEEDRTKAKSYGNITDCLVATALKRMGYRHPCCGGHVHTINHTNYWSDDTGSSDLYAHNGSYDKAVVGKRITLEKTTREY